MSYYANAPGEANKKFKAAYFAKFGDKAPQLGLIGADCYGGIYCAQALVTKAGGTDAKKCMAASEGLSFPTAAGPVTMRGRHVDKTMFLADLQGHRIRHHQDLCGRQERRRVQGLVQTGSDQSSHCEERKRRSDPVPLPGSDCFASLAMTIWSVQPNLLTLKASNGSADRHPGDQRTLRSLDACGARAWARRDLRPARRAQYRPRRIRHDRRLLRLRHAGRRLALSRRRAFHARGVRDTRRRGRMDHDPSALPPAVRHAGGDLGLEPAAAQDRRGDVRSRLSQRQYSVAGNGQAPGHRIPDLSPALDRDLARGRCRAGGLVWAQPHRQPHSRHGQQSGTGAGAGHFGAAARGGHICRRHLPRRARRRHGGAARAGAALHGAGLCAQDILCSDRRRARQRVRAACRERSPSAASTA